MSSQHTNSSDSAASFLYQGFLVLLHGPDAQGHVRFAVYREGVDVGSARALLGSGTRDTLSTAKKAAQRMVVLLAGHV